MTLKDFDLVALYNQYNKQYFQGKLPKGLPYKATDKDSYGLTGIGIGINRVKGMLGTATAMAYQKSGRLVPISVHLSSVYEWNETKVKEILIHEMIHVLVDVIYSTDLYGYYRNAEDANGGHSTTFMKTRTQLMSRYEGLNIPIREDSVTLSSDYVAKKTSDLVVAYFGDYNAVKFVKVSAIKKAFDDMSPEMLKSALSNNNLHLFYAGDNERLAQFPTSRELFSNKGMYRLPIPKEEILKLEKYDFK